MLLVLLLPARLTLHVAGDAARELAIDLRWRVLVVRGRRRLLALSLDPAAAAAAAPVAPPVAAPVHAPAITGTQPASSEAARAARPTLRARLRALESRVEVARRVLRSGAVRVGRAHGWIELALDDVAETGRAFGWICALAALVDPQRALEIVPRWDLEDHLAADVALDARVYPLWLALVLGSALLRARRRRGEPRDEALASDAA